MLYLLFNIYITLASKLTYFDKKHGCTCNLNNFVKKKQLPQTTFSNGVAR